MRSIFLSKRQAAKKGFILPTVLVLSVVLLTLGLSVFQLTSSIARSLTDQYWQRLSKQTAQAGMSYVSACIDQGLSPSTWPVTITQNNDCLGNTLNPQIPSVYDNTSSTNPFPNPYKTSFVVYRPIAGSDGIAKARVVGTVSVLNTAGNTVIKSYTTDMLVIVNGPTQAFTQISAGSKHVCALTDGRVYCWGSNAANPFSGGTTDNTITGQLGIGTTDIDKTIPTLVGGALVGKYVTQVAAGYNFTCALASGKVYCWGANASGQLGNGNTTTSTVPVAVTTSGSLSGKTVTAISAGLDFACALASGQVYCWGNGANGQHGNNTTNTTSTPDTAVNTITQVSAISVGANHACAIANGAAYCWGNGSNGQLGNGTTTNPQRTPVQVTGSGVSAGGTVYKISANNNYTCALVNGATPYCWGYNLNGQLGNNNTTQQNTAAALTTTNVVGMMTDITSSSAAEYHTCAIANGNAYCWGAGWAGQLGNNGTGQSNLPVAVNTSGLLPTNRTITAITTGAAFTCALAEGQPYCWGKGAAGSLGDGVDNTSCGCDYYPNSVPKKTINSY